MLSPHRSMFRWLFPIRSRSHHYNILVIRDFCRNNRTRATRWSLQQVLPSNISVKIVRLSFIKTLLSTISSHSFHQICLFIIRLWVLGLITCDKDQEHSSGAIIEMMDLTGIHIAALCCSALIFATIGEGTSKTTSFDEFGYLTVLSVELLIPACIKCCDPLRYTRNWLHRSVLSIKLRYPSAAQ